MENVSRFRDPEFFQRRRAISRARETGRASRAQLSDARRSRIDGSGRWKFRRRDQLFGPGAQLLFNPRRYSPRHSGGSGCVEQTQETETRARAVAHRAPRKWQCAGRAALAKHGTGTSWRISVADSSSERDTAGARAILTNNSALGLLDKIDNLADFLGLRQVLPHRLHRLRRIIFRAVNQAECFLD